MNNPLGIREIELAANADKELSNIRKRVQNGNVAQT